jgi:hypothetical protein
MMAFACTLLATLAANAAATNVYSDARPVLRGAPSQPVETGAPESDPPFLVNPCLDSSKPFSKQPWCDATLDYDTRVEDMISRMTLAEKIGALDTKTPAIPSLGLPAYNWWSEATHGLMGGARRQRREQRGRAVGGLVGAEPTSAAVAALPVGEGPTALSGQRKCTEEDAEFRRDTRFKSHGILLILVAAA